MRHLETEQAKILTNQTLKIDPKKSFLQISHRGLNRSFTVLNKTFFWNKEKTGMDSHGTCPFPEK